MVSGNPLHKPSGNESGLETSGHLFNPPLLPYEKDLISFLECSEEEYRSLLRYNNILRRVRPAEYEHIPDVVNDPVVIITSIVIGLATTAVSSLLAPKPEIPEAAEQKERKKIRQEQLPNDVGPSRFNQTSSFDGYAALVAYGVPVPIPFGKVGTDGDGLLSGGLVLAASLVWSRAYSYGSFQRVKCLYTLGEHIRPRPDVRGVWLGTQSASALGDADFALYWKSQSGENRIKAGNLIAGSRGTNDAGDPETQDETFVAPIDGIAGGLGPGFCMVNNPVSKAVFGQFNPLRNGTAHRLNWEVISAPFEALRDQNTDDENDKDAVRRKRAERIKNGGNRAGVLGLNGIGTYAGQPGMGRAYGTQMGLVAYARPGQGFIESADKVNKITGVAPGWRVKYRINSANFSGLDVTGYPENIQQGAPINWGIQHKDVTSAVDNQRVRADDLLVIGTKWLIGGTQWVLESRDPPNQVWRPQRTNDDGAVIDPGIVINAIFRCVSVNGAPVIGIAGTRASTELLGGYEGPWIDYLMDGPPPSFISPEGFNTKKHCGAAYWNVVRYEVATARMPRISDTVEFGIRSEVWNQASGLCNFNAIPKPSELFLKDQDDLQVNTPTLSRYFKRTSCFSIFVRPIPQYEEIGSAAPKWDRIPQVFCVTGDSPRAMYNYLRVRPRNKGLYEFRFVPRVGSDIAINSFEDAVFLRLNAVGEVIGEDFETDYGSFRITITGERVNRAAVLSNEELLTDPIPVYETPGGKTTIPTAIIWYAWGSTPEDPDWPKNAWLTQILGSPFGLSSGTVRSQTIVFTKVRGSGPEDDGTISITVSAAVQTQSGPKHLQTYGTNKNWMGNGSRVSFTVNQDASYGQWASGDQFTITRDITSGNPYSNQNYTSVSFSFRVTSVIVEEREGTINLNDGERAFELFSQVSDCSHYDEITKSCDAGPEHQLSYINYAISEGDDDGSGDGIPDYDDLAMLGLSLKSGPSIGAIEQPRVWVNGGIGVERLERGVFGISNLLSDLIYYLLTDKKQGLGDIIPEELVDRNSLAETSRYLLANKIYWNGVVESDVNFRSFATAQAQLSLCMFTVKNGVFGMMPALPVSSSMEISRSAVAAEGIFSAGNIIGGSFKLSFVPAEERRSTALQVRWRQTVPYELPEERTAIVQFNDENPEAIEDYDLTQFCDNRYQALLTTRYALAARRFIDHTVEFQTTPDAIGIQPGSYIRVLTEEAEFQNGLALKINEDMSIVSPEPVEDGTYRASVYLPGSEGVIETEIIIANQLVQNQQLRGSIASLFKVAPAQRFYQVSELTLGDDGIVNVTATFVPTRSDGSSEIAYYTRTPSAFKVIV